MVFAAIRNLRWEYDFACLKNVTDLGSGDCCGAADKKGYVANGVFNSVGQLNCSKIIVSATNASSTFPAGTVIEVYGK